MRLWHYELIPVLPRQQLLGQWRELNSIYVNQNKHVLINFVYNYPEYDLQTYSVLVIEEMQKRGYKMNLDNFFIYFFDFRSCDQDVSWLSQDISYYIPFEKKMNDRYLRQCYYNLQEKYDCGAINKDEWKLIKDKFGDRI